MSANQQLAGQAPQPKNELKAEQAREAKARPQTAPACGAATTQLTLESIMARYVACTNEGQKHRALEAAWAVLSRPSSQEEPLLNLKQISEHFDIDPSTAWRWQLPCCEWRGLKRYLVSKCEAYLASEEFRKRRQELGAQRQGSTNPEQADGVGHGLEKKGRGRPSAKAPHTKASVVRKKGDHR